MGAGIALPCLAIMANCACHNRQTRWISVPEWRLDFGDDPQHGYRRRRVFFEQFEIFRM
jgi:hypothetical protein